MNGLWRAIAPVAVAALLALLPAPDGLAQHAWYYFAIFAGVIVGLMVEPLPGSVVGLIGLTVVTVLHPFVLYSPEELARPGFNPADAALGFALSGFSNATLWLIFAAFMFALGYEKSGLGKRIALTLVKSMGRNTLTLRYAIVVAETPPLSIVNAYLFPNPARSGFGGQFVVDALGDSVNAMLRIYTASGRMIRSMEFVGRQGQIQIPWDGLDHEGYALANGTYFFRVQLNARDADGESSAQRKAAAEGRFVILNR